MWLSYCRWLVNTVAAVPIHVDFVSRGAYDLTSSIDLSVLELNILGICFNAQSNKNAIKKSPNFQQILHFYGEIYPFAAPEMNAIGICLFEGSNI